MYYIILMSIFGIGTIVGVRIAVKRAIKREIASALNAPTDDWDCDYD